MRKLLSLWVAVGLSAAAFDAAPARSAPDNEAVAETARFSFYSNSWLNLHHYLFNIAKDYEADALAEHLSTFGLSDEEAGVFGDAAAFYRGKLIDNSLLFNRDLFAVKRMLIAIPAGADLSLGQFPDLEGHLRRSYPIYLRHFWPAHRQANQQVLDQNLALVSKLEDEIFERIAELSQNQWPDHKVRADLTYMANWSGAYTTVYPTTHAVIRSTGWKAPYDWFEILFHEPTHALILPDAGTVAQDIKRISGQLGKQPQGGLWHGILFYFAGTAVQESLATEGIDYEMFMFRNGTFGKLHGVLRRHLPAYVAGEVSLERAIQDILIDPGK